MLSCEGYKMFRGSATIVPVNGKAPYDIVGDWLYKPEWDCWYCKGRSYPASIVQNIVDYHTEFMYEVMEKVQALEDVIVTVENVEAVKKAIDDIKSQLVSFNV